MYVRGNVGEVYPEVVFPFSASISTLISNDPAVEALEETDATFLGSEGLAPLSDPSWTPLFVPVEAMVFDVGGQMSHAIIVSRELGLPCVVSATDVTKCIPEGALIEVDGAAGTITVLEI